MRPSRRRSGLRPTISVIGSVGVPNRYGGLESFAENILPRLAAMGFDVVVTCDRSRYLDDLDPSFRGVRRKFLRVRANGIWAPVHDLIAFASVAFRSDYVLVLGVSAGIFFPIFRLICALRCTRLLVNIDGVEWRRSKFGLFARTVLYCSDVIAQRFAHVVIYDNEALREYVRYPTKSVCVRYSGEHAVAAAANVGSSTPSKPYALTVCRIEPENNCEVLIEGFLQSSFREYRFVGNWSSSEYGRSLRGKYANRERLVLLDPVYDSNTLFGLRSNCQYYLHGHSVGGTNPSLVEMLFFDCEIFCWDCSFNRATAGDAVQYFSSTEALADQLDSQKVGAVDRTAVRQMYSEEAIVRDLLSALDLAATR